MNKKMAGDIACGFWAALSNKSNSQVREGDLLVSIDDEDMSDRTLAYVGSRVTGKLCVRTFARGTELKFAGGGE